MKIKFLNDDENTIELPLSRYEVDTHKEEDNRNGYLLIQETYKLFIKCNELKEFIKNSNDLHSYIYFDNCDDGRIKKMYSPSIEIKDKCILVETIKTIQF